MNILMVRQSRGFVLISVREQLMRCAYNIVEVRADTDAIHEVPEPVHCILIYADDSLLEEKQALFFIRDRALSHDIPIVVLGEKKNIDEIKSVISAELIKLDFARPVHVVNMVASIDRFLRKYHTQNKKKILVVDDSGEMLRNIKGWLEDKYSVALVNSAAMAIKYMSLNRPELILLDYEMPIVDGKQVMEIINTEQDFADIPVMFLTNRSDKASIMGVMELHPEAYLLKTLEPAKIVEAVDSFFDKKKAMLV